MKKIIAFVLLMVTLQAIASGTGDKRVFLQKLKDIDTGAVTFSMRLKRNLPANYESPKTVIGQGDSYKNLEHVLDAYLKRTGDYSSRFSQQLREESRIYTCILKGNGKYDLMGATLGSSYEAGDQYFVSDDMVVRDHAKVESDQKEQEEPPETRIDLPAQVGETQFVSIEFYNWFHFPKKIWIECTGPGVRYLTLDQITSLWPDEVEFSYWKRTPPAAPGMHK